LSYLESINFINCLIFIAFYTKVNKKLINNLQKYSYKINKKKGKLLLPAFDVKKAPAKKTRM